MPLNSETEAVIQEIERLTDRKQRIVFVSGNFNIVHPGHLRLLRFAKECGDFLVVGLYDQTAAGILLPEELRRESISSISWVDYAFVLRNSPEETIRRLKPDFVVKGKEHEDRFNPEQEAVNTYGGKLLFGSGDVSFSSIDLLKKEFLEFNLSTINKPVDYLRRHKIEFNQLIDVMRLFNELNVCVIGDLIVDEYVSCEPLGMSQEDPTIVVTPIMAEKFIGGAGIVAAHARGMGANVRFVSIVGTDPTADFARKKLLEQNMDIHFFHEEGRPTPLKQRFRASGKTLLRVSHLRHHSITREMQNKLFMDITEIINGCDLLIFADFNYGLLPQELVNRIVKLAQEKSIMMVADSQSSSQLGDISRFVDMDILTPTEREVRIALRDFDSGLIVVAEALRKRSRAKNILVTLGREGVLVHATNPENEADWLTDKLPAFNSSPKDISGAGDSLLVGASLCRAVGKDIWFSTYFGSLMAACQVGRLGNLPLSPADLEAEIRS